MTAADVQKVVTEIESRQDYQEWKAKNKGAYLSSAFIAIEAFDEIAKANDVLEKEWLISYYDEHADKFTTFSSQKEGCSTEEGFKEQRSVRPLVLQNVNVGLFEALQAAKEFVQKKFPDEEASKAFAVLQALQLGEKEAQVWNTTLITAAFRILNVKVSAADKDVLAHSLSSIADFMRL